MNRMPCPAFTDHVFQVPLDHADPHSTAIEVFAREVVHPETSAGICRGCCSCKADRVARPTVPCAPAAGSAMP